MPSVDRLRPEALGRLTSEVFLRLGLAPADVEVVSATLLEASLAGYDSHGLMRIAVYAEDIRAGRVDVTARPRVLRESAASALLDGAWAIGPVTAAHAVTLAGVKARAVGVGCVAARRCNDLARLGAYVRAPAEQGLLSLLFVNDAGDGAAVVPQPGSPAFLSTNPIAAGIPRRDGPPMVVDLATATAAIGKLRMALNRGLAVPEGWLVDAAGVTVTDPAAFFAEPRGAGLLPLGGVLAGHKGYALGLLVDVLAGALGGAGTSRGVVEEGGRNGLCVIAIDPAYFGPPAEFLDRVESLAVALAGLPVTPGRPAVRLPGEGAERERRRRMREGVPVDGPTWAGLCALMQSLGLDPAACLEG